MADDDAPLSDLANIRNSSGSRKLDDDTPLSALAAGKAKTPATAKKGVPKAAPKGAVGRPSTAKPKGRPSTGGAKGKNEGSSSSSSSSSSGSGSSSSESDAGVKKRASKEQRLKMLKRKQVEDAAGDDGGAVKKKDRTTKEQVVADLLCRWWYSAEYLGNDWPPQKEEFYQEELEKRKLRKVTIQEWEWLPEEDEAGRHKVYEMSQFRGVYRNSQGELVDLRPKDTCPCFNNFMKKDLATLCNMLISAYENQMLDLKNSKYAEEKTEGDLRNAVTRARKMLHEAAQLKRP